jgi:hypothetical protein
MKIRVTNRDSGQLLKTVDYNALLEICGGDARMADDFIRLIRHHPDNAANNERWELTDD